MHYDEILDMWTEAPLGRLEPLFLLVNAHGAAEACAPTRAEAQRKQLELGVRTSTQIVET